MMVFLFVGQAVEARVVPTRTEATIRCVSESTFTLTFHPIRNGVVMVGMDTTITVNLPAAFIHFIGVKRWDLRWEVTTTIELADENGTLRFSSWVGHLEGKVVYSEPAQGSVFIQTDLPNPTYSPILVRVFVSPDRYSRKWIGDQFFARHLAMVYFSRLGNDAFLDPTETRQGVLDGVGPRRRPGPIEW